MATAFDSDLNDLTTNFNNLSLIKFGENLSDIEFPEKLFKAINTKENFLEFGC